MEPVFPKVFPEISSAPPRLRVSPHLFRLSYDPAVDINTPQLMDLDDELARAMNEAVRAAQTSQQPEQLYGIRAGVPPIAPWPTAPCKIVFLDFDGVLNSHQSLKELGTLSRFDQNNVAALNDLLLRSDARIVISSSWRESFSLVEVAGFLARDRVVAGRIAGKTPTMDGNRGVEIDHWLQAAPYHVASFVILDDKQITGAHANRLVRTDQNVGLRSGDVDRALELLQGR